MKDPKCICELDTKTMKRTPDHECPFHRMVSELVITVRMEEARGLMLEEARRQFDEFLENKEKERDKKQKKRKAQAKRHHKTLTHNQFEGLRKK